MSTKPEYRGLCVLLDRRWAVVHKNIQLLDLQCGFHSLDPLNSVDRAKKSVYCNDQAIQ